MALIRLEFFATVAQFVCIPSLLTKTQNRRMIDREINIARNSSCSDNSHSTQFSKGESACC